MDRSDKQEILDAISAVGAKVNRLDTRLTHIEGQLSVLLAWMQAVDQRFTAIMHPYEPTPPSRKRTG
jgi:hypothetical protein